MWQAFVTLTYPFICSPGGWPIRTTSFLGSCGVRANGLADCSSCQTILTLCDEAVSLPAASFPTAARSLHSSELCIASQTDPSTLSWEEASVLVSLIQAQLLLLLVPQKSSCPHIPIRLGLLLQPPTHTCKSHSCGVGFIITGLKAFSWTQATDSKGEEGKSLVVCKLSSSSCLLCRWVSGKKSLGAFSGVDV